MSTNKTPRLGLSLRHFLFGALIVAGFFSATLWILDTFFSGNSISDHPKLLARTPLQPVTRTSVIVAPVAVAALAIRDVLEANAPRDLNGKRDNPLSDLLGKADIGWSISRGADLRIPCSTTMPLPCFCSRIWCWKKMAC